MDAADFRQLEMDGWFAALPTARRSVIAAALRVRDVAAGTRLYRLGDRPDGLHVVLAGRVELVTYPAAGTEMVVMIVKPGRWFGELSVLDARPRPQDAVAAVPSRVAMLPIAANEALAMAAPVWWRELALLNCAHQRLGLRHAARTRTQPALVRMAALLAGSAGHDGGRVRITQEELARTVGVSRQHTNRLLGELAGRGLLRRTYGAIEIGGGEALRRFVAHAAEED